MKLKVYFVLCLSILIYSCGEDDFPVTLEPAQVERLLTSDSSKIWKPEEGDLFLDCELDNEITFTYTSVKDKLGTYKEERGSNSCSETEEESKEGTFEVTTTTSGINQLTIYFPNDSTISYNINLITASILELTLKDKSKKRYVLP